MYSNAKGYKGLAYLDVPMSATPFIVQDLLPVRGYLNIYAEPKVGKSLLALQMASAIASGDPTFLGLTIQQPAPVLYVQMDNPRATWLGVKVPSVRSAGYDIDNIVFVDKEMHEQDVPHPFDILSATNMPGTGYHWLKALCLNHPECSVVVLDTIREIHSSNENDSQAMKILIDLAVDAAGDKALVFVSHSRKPSEHDTIMTAQRGSSGIMGKMDAIVRLTGGTNTTSQMDYISRTTEGVVNVKMARTVNQTWVSMGDPFTAAVQKLWFDLPGSSPNDIAECVIPMLGWEWEEGLVKRLARRALMIKQLRG